MIQLHGKLVHIHKDRDCKMMICALETSVPRRSTAQPRVDSENIIMSVLRALITYFVKMHRAAGQSVTDNKKM